MSATQVLEAVPLVRIETAGLTDRPEPGRYYQDAGRHMLLCIGARGEYYWFVDAEVDPIIVRSAEELAAAPLEAVDLLPVREGP
jgi:hypothetical protein